MKSIQSFIPFLVFILSITGCRHNKVLVQRPVKGSDTYVHEFHPSRNFSYDNKIAVMVWTYDGADAACRGLIRFDLSSIPATAKITMAELYLYHVTDHGKNPRHSQLSGSNAAYLVQVSSPWGADSVTWNNQPAVISENQVVIPASTSETQDYIIDVTAMVKNMVKQPESNNGFMIRLQNEEYYRALMFANSHNKNPKLHPTLRVLYK